MNTNVLEKLLEALVSLAQSALHALLIIVIGYVVYKLIRKMTTRLVEKSPVDPIIVDFVNNILKFCFMIVVGIMALDALGVNMTSVTAVFTAAAAAIALAAKETLSGLIDGVKLLLAKPFSKGDLIEVDGTMGMIQEISLFYTYLLTLDNKRVVIPNSTIANTLFVNYSAHDTRRLDLYFDVAYDTDINEARKVLEDICAQNPLTAQDAKPFVGVNEYKDSSISLVLRTWVATPQYDLYKFEIQEKVKEEFEKHGIEIPYPQIDVHQAA